MHLLEDTTQPQHVRNEQHLDYIPHTTFGLTNLGLTNFYGIPSPWQSPIENYGFANIFNKLNYQHGMLDWRGAGFTKLEDFWDRHLYNRNPAVLSADTSGGSNTLGLAEWCNGNFLGVRHKYAEYYQTNSIKYYPFPSRTTSTDYRVRQASLDNLIAGANTLTLKNGLQVKAIYLKKTGDGITMDYMSRFTYFGGRFPHYAPMTIRDDNVLSNYHAIFIPRAVQYSAGLLDYFFRGTISSSVTGYDSGSNQFTNVIVNTSSK